MNFLSYCLSWAKFPITWLIIAVASEPVTTRHRARWYFCLASLLNFTCLSSGFAYLLEKCWLPLFGKYYYLKDALPFITDIKYSNFIINKHCGFIEFRVKISIYHWLYNSGRAFYLFSDFVMICMKWERECLGCWCGSRPAQQSGWLIHGTVKYPVAVDIKEL